MWIVFLVVSEKKKKYFLKSLISKDFFENKLSTGEW